MCSCVYSVCVQVEAGDVIVKVNGTDVHRFSTKEGELKYATDVLNIVTSVRASLCGYLWRLFLHSSIHPSIHLNFQKHATTSDILFSFVGAKTATTHKETSLSRSSTLCLQSLTQSPLILIPHFSVKMPTTLQGLGHTGSETR